MLHIYHHKCGKGLERGHRMCTDMDQGLLVSEGVRESFTEEEAI